MQRLNTVNVTPNPATYYKNNNNNNVSQQVINVLKGLSQKTGEVGL